MKKIIENIVRIFSYEELPKTFAIFYSVGFALFALPVTRPLFLFILPLSLLFVFAAVLLHHKRWDTVFVLYGAGVMVISFFTEMAGVRTGLIFGSYTYLGSLGIKLYDTPLMIGVNWFMLTYCSAAIMSYASKRSGGVIGSAVKITGGALLMLFYDFIAELVAPVMNMWEFTGTYPPVQNFVMWFVLALTFHIVLSALKIKATGKPAMALFGSQLVFFLLIYLYSLVNI